MCDKLYLSNHWTEFNFCNAYCFRFVLRIVHLKKKYGPFWFFGPFSKILAILCIWELTSRPLIWLSSESNFVHLKLRYGIYEFFSIFFNFLLARLWQAVSFQPLNRIQFFNAQFFRFVLRIVLLKKNVGLFGTFWEIFPILSLFFLICDFFSFWNI